MCHPVPSFACRSRRSKEVRLELDGDGELVVAENEKRSGEERGASEVGRAGDGNGDGGRVNHEAALGLVVGIGKDIPYPLDKWENY